MKCLFSRYFKKRFCETRNLQKLVPCLGDLRLTSQIFFEFVMSRLVQDPKLYSLNLGIKLRTDWICAHDRREHKRSDVGLNLIYFYCSRGTFACVRVIRARKFLG
jgi:hypothetical protein